MRLCLSYWGCGGSERRRSFATRKLHLESSWVNIICFESIKTLILAIDDLVHVRNPFLRLFLDFFDCFAVFVKMDPASLNHCHIGLLTRGSSRLEHSLALGCRSLIINARNRHLLVLFIFLHCSLAYVDSRVVRLCAHVAHLWLLYLFNYSFIS